MTPRTVLILCERAPVKVNPVPAVRYGEKKCARPTFCGSDGETCAVPGCDFFVPDWKCSYCGRRVQVVA